MIKLSNQKVYFPNLNGLRFIAAFLVIINHVEQLRLFYKIGEGPISQFAKIVGKLGVMLFFVLSGFLITYLLLSEERSFGAIHTRKFYARRFLRIVPLYGLLVFVVFFIIQHFSFWDIPNMKDPIDDNFYTTLVLHIFFLPNLVTAIYGFLPYIAQAWSIGTEEQSYLLWPLLLRKFKKNRLRLMVGIIVSYIMVRLFLWLPFIELPYERIISRFLSHFNIDCIAVGGFFAILLFQKHKLLDLIVNQTVFYLVSVFTISMITLGVIIPEFHYLGYSILFGIIILNLAANPKLKNILEWSVLNYLGRISYGIYMYHFIILILVLKLAAAYNIKSDLIIYPLILLGTIVISSLSYHYFEAVFLRLKTKFTLIKSGGSKF